MERIPNYIDGELVPPSSGRYLNNVDPATGKVYSYVAGSEEGDVSLAAAAARRAFVGWSTTPASERSRLMLAIADRIESDVERFARAESVDSGKPFTLARDVEIPRAVANLRFFGTRILHTSSETHVTDTVALNYTLRRPRGVVGLISPWNLPLYLLTWKVAPAIATGNTAVAKPSELTPMTAHLLAQVCIEAGLPEGVLNIVHGAGSTAGAAITTHPDISTISFTGGTATGAEIARVTGPQFKKVALEMGGKNPNVVFADADIDDRAVERRAFRAAFSNQGQICLCGSRGSSWSRAAYDVLRRGGSCDATETLRVGRSARSRPPQQGAVVSPTATSRRSMSLHRPRPRRKGARSCAAESPPEPTFSDRCRDGFFRPPHRRSPGSTSTCRVNQEEIFGPVVTDHAFTTTRTRCWPGTPTAPLRAVRVGLDPGSGPGPPAGRSESPAGTVWVNCWLVRDLRVPVRRHETERGGPRGRATRPCASSPSPRTSASSYPGSAK